MPHMTDKCPYGPIDFDDPEFQADPWQRYAWYREHEPLHWSTTAGSYVAFGYDLCRNLLTAAQFSAYHPFRASRRAFGPSMLDSDGADHARMRRAGAGMLRPRKIAQYGPLIVRPLVNALLDELLLAGRADFIEVLARELPMRVVCRVLGLPESDAAWLFETMRPLVRYVDHAEVSLADVVAHRRLLRDYLVGAGLTHRAATDGTAKATPCPASHGAGTTQTRLAPFADSLFGADLSDREVIDNSLLLLAAGTETTAAAIVNVLCRLAYEPGLFPLLQDSRQLVPAAVAETIRHEPPLHVTLRFAAREMDLQEIPLVAGAPLQVCLASANRDPRVFPDPDRWMLNRTGPVPMTFGVGQHACLGMGLANLELELVVNGVLDRLESLTLLGEGLPHATGRTFRSVPSPRCTYQVSARNSGRPQ